MAQKDKANRVPVSRRGVIQRINRALANEGRAGEKLKAARGNAVTQLGDYYIVDLDTNAVVSSFVDPEEYARELGVLQDYEEMAD